MSFDLSAKKYNKEIEKFLKRIEVNHILCAAPLNDIGKSWTEKECNDWIKNDKYHKLTIRNVFLLNDYNNPNIKTQGDEYEELSNCLQGCAESILKIIHHYCEQGENLYALNELIRNSVRVIDSKIETMNFEAWLNQQDQNGNDNYYFLLLAKKRIPKSKMEIDVKSHCTLLLNHDFSYRTSLLFRFKEFLVDIFSDYLLLPAIGTNPQIKYSCTPTDICELLFAISNFGVITDSGKLKAILLDMFNITPEFYNRACYDIRNRTKDKSVFVKQLSLDLNKLKPKKKKKSAK